MFPLGTVLYPHAVLPLHVFEPRYRALTERCLAEDGLFGVVLIERGSEVGGGDQRFSVGTVARIVQAGRLDDGRWMLVTVGERRLRVTHWLADDPYPRAEIELLDEITPGDTSGRVAEVTRLLRRALALRAELGEPGPPTVELAPDDAARAGFQACAAAGLRPLDAQRLLETDDAGVRLERLGALLEDAVALLEFRLQSD